MSANTLLISVQMLIDRSALHGNVDPKLIYSDIKAAQDMHILPILGSGLYEKLQDLVEEDTIGDAGNADYKTLLDSYIVDALVNFVLSELPMGLSYQMWNKGVLRSGNDNSELPTMTELVTIADKYRHRAEYYANRLKLYLKQNATGSKYPEYINPGTGIDTIHPSARQYTMPIYLGDAGGCDDCPDKEFTKYAKKTQ